MEPNPPPVEEPPPPVLEALALEPAVVWLLPVEVPAPVPPAVMPLEEEPPVVQWPSFEMQLLVKASHV